MYQLNDDIAAERLYRSLILIVEDIEVNRRMLSHSLQARGYTNIATATDGAQALEMTLELKPALVILDLMMPGMDGFAYCQAIRRDHAFDDMPILVQTALSDMEQKLRAFELGATDYICKPIDPGELSARTQVHLLQKIMMQDLKEYRRAVSAELAAARTMQNRLMPGEPQIQMCERVYDMKIASHFETSSALGGDCWGMRPLSDSRLALYMYDFSGHGITAALNVFRMHTIMQEYIHAGGDPGNLLSTLNRHLFPLLERDEFATMFYGLIDTDANCFLYASAAAPPALLFSENGAQSGVLHGRGFPLGVVANATYETKYTPFTNGDLLLLYSDCMIESKAADGEFLSEAHIQKAVQEALAQPHTNAAKVTVESLLQLLHSHCDGPIQDDLTINAYGRCPK